MITFKQLRENAEAGYHAVNMKKKNVKMFLIACQKKSTCKCSNDNSNVALPPAVEPGVHVKEKETSYSLLKESLNRVEVENVINKITTSQ